MDEQDPEVQDLKRKIEAQEKRIAELEALLSVRFEKTKTDYQRLKPFFDSQKNRVMQLFYDNFPCRLSYDQIVELYRQRHPQGSTVHLARRIKEMVQEKRLVSSYDPQTKRVVFHLCLFPDDKANSTKAKLSEEHRES